MSAGNDFWLWEFGVVSRLVDDSGGTRVAKLLDEYAYLTTCAVESDRKQ